MRSRDRTRAAALQAEVVALRATVAGLRDELARVQADAASAAAVADAQVSAAVAAAAAAPPAWLTLRMPLVKLALGDPDDVAAGPEVAAALAAPDRSPDTAESEIVLESSDAPAPADRLAWRVLANLPERPLLDPRLDRDAEPRDPAAPAASAAPAEHRRTA